MLSEASRRLPDGPPARSTAQIVPTRRFPVRVFLLSGFFIVARYGISLLKKTARYSVDRRSSPDLEIVLIEIKAGVADLLTTSPHPHDI